MVNQEVCVKFKWEERSVVSSAIHDGPARLLGGEAGRKGKGGREARLAPCLLTHRAVSEDLCLHRASVAL